jgi:hypothetical protein
MFDVCIIIGNKGKKREEGGKAAFLMQYLCRQNTGRYPPDIKSSE